MARKRIERPNNERLVLAFENAGYDVMDDNFTKTVAAKMLRFKVRDVPLIEWSPCYNDRKELEGKIGSIGRSINKHLGYDDCTSVSGDWVRRYCLFLSVSADFLYGLIDSPTAELTSVCQSTGLSTAATKTLIEYKKTAAIEKHFRETVLQDSAPAAAYNLLADTVSFLLRPEHTKPGGAGLLHLIGRYITSDDMSLSTDLNLPDTLKTDSYNGSGIEFDVAEVFRAAIPNLILMRLNEYRAERLSNRRNKKKTPQKGS